MERNIRTGKLNDFNVLHASGSNIPSEDRGVVTSDICDDLAMLRSRVDPITR